MLKRIFAGVAAMLLSGGALLAQPEPANDTPSPALSATTTDGASPRERQFSISADFLLGFTLGNRLPPLVTTSPDGTARAVAGALDQATTSTLFSGFANNGARPGFRFGADWWFNNDPKLGLEAGFMFLGNQDRTFRASSDDFAILARPYTKAQDSSQQAVLVAFPGSSTGSIEVRAASNVFYSAHLDITERAIDEGWFRLNALLGYRFYRSDESLRIRQSMFPTVVGAVPGTMIVANDNFTAQNIFHGIDLGFKSQFIYRSLTLDVTTKIAVGRLRRVVGIGGDQTISVPGAADLVQSGGVFALSSNIGSYYTRDYKVVPEAGFLLTWQWRPNVALRFGYSFLLLNGVMRAADQYDKTLNPNLFPGSLTSGGPSQPIFPFHRTDVWVQAINFGVEFTY